MQPPSPIKIIKKLQGNTMSICLAINKIDWSLTKDFISILGGAITLFIAWRGLSTWRTQLRGTNEYELAKQTILKSYQVQQAIQNVRSPLLTLKREAVEQGRQLEEEQRIYDERMQNLLTTWTELQIIRLETKVIWSNDAYDRFIDLQNLIGQLRAGIWLHFWLKGAYVGPGAIVDNNPDRVAANDAIVYFVSDDDEFSQKIGSAINKIESFFGKKIRS
jgi:hypothetical protein